MTEICHITTRAAWLSASALGQYFHPSLQAEGFICCCRKDQVLRVANSHFRSREDLVILKINPAKLKSPLRDDFNDSGELFPRVYGTINADAVHEVIALDPASDGTFSWSEELETQKAFSSERNLISAVRGSESQFQSHLT